MSHVQPHIERVWTVLDLIQWGSDYFRQKGVDSPRLTIELMLCAVLDVPRVQLYTGHDRPLSRSELDTLRGYVKRRIHHEPLQYILGEAPFYGLTVTVSPAVLIPRPETELLVDQALRFLKDRQQALCLDIGTGSGIIPVTCAVKNPHATWIALDIAHDACLIAEANSKRHAVDHLVTILRQDALSMMPAGPFDLITMNPPYIPANEVADLEAEVRDFEPHVALTDDADGLTFYRMLSNQVDTVLKPGGCALMEMMHGQSDDVQALFAQCHGSVSLIDDLAGIPRILRYVHGR
jgi:release factor glutamine methyltransferase